MDVALGLDVSTSIIGWTVLPISFIDPARQKPLLWGHIDLRKIETGFWTKVDEMEAQLSAVISSVAESHSIVRLYIEDPVERFRNGLSSAHTIALLARFNALTSRHARSLTGLNPVYIDATAARNAIGVPLLSKKKANGLDQKTQTFMFLSETVFRDEVWPLNRNKKVQPWVFDRVDSYVICLAGCLGVGDPS